MPRGRIAKPPGFAKEWGVYKKSPAVGTSVPGSSGPSPLPWDSTAELGAGNLASERNNSVAGLDTGWQAEQENLGLGQYANNPYSQAALLSHQRDVGNRGVVNGSGQQLYAGSTVNARRGVAGAYDRGRQALEAKARQDQTAYELKRREAEQGYQSGLGQLQEGALDRAIQSTPPPAPLGPTKVTVRVPRRRGRGR